MMQMRDKRSGWAPGGCRVARVGLAGLALALVAASASAAPVDAPAASPAKKSDGADLPALASALAESSTVAGARVELVALEGASASCRTDGADVRVETSRPVDGSGRFAVKLIGHTATKGARCELWAWARLRVFASVRVARRPIRAGEALTPATIVEEREIRSGHVPMAAVDGLTADRAIGAGQMIEEGTARAPGPRAGEPIKVVIVLGALAVEQDGHVLPCSAGRTCAVLPSGKRVEGALVDGRLMVGTP